MRYCIDTRSIHPHMAPFADSMKSNLGSSDSVSYIYRSTPNDPNRAIGAKGLVEDIAQFWDGETDDVGRKCVISSDVLIENHRDFELMEERVRNGRFTVYQSERWFKPIYVGFLISGFFRMVLPFGIKRAIKIMRLFRKGKNFFYFPLGAHAARDMARLCGLMNGDIRCLFRAPDIEFERKPCGRIWLRGGGSGERYCLDKMRMWGYFVPQLGESASMPVSSDKRSNGLKVLWVGRILRLKNVDVIIKAVAIVANERRGSITLDIYGDGPAAKKLKALAKQYSGIVSFHSSVPYSSVREIMRCHDLYVFCSNALEGWGAVLNEALAEGMLVLSSSEPGAATVLLPKECLFKSRDVRRLVQLLSGAIPRVGIGDWTADSAAKNFIRFVKETLC